MILLCAIAIGLLPIAYFSLIRPFRFWTDKGVSQLSVTRLWWENIKTILQLQSSADWVRNMYNLNPGARYVGIYQLVTPFLLIKDIDLLKQLTVKDFDHFTDRNQLLDEKCDPLWGKNLLALKGERWKDIRATLSPSFTSSKMKGMFHLMSACAENFVLYFQSESTDTVVVELKDTFTRYTNDVIASASFGITCDSLKDRDNEFYLMGKQASDFSGFWRNITLLIMVMSSRLANFLGLKVYNDKVSNFFRTIVVGNMKEREEKGIIRPDMVHLLMEARKGKLKHDDHVTGVVDQGFAVIDESTMGKEERRQTHLDDDDVTAQALIFFIAGFDSVSSLMCFCSYELAINPTIQEKLRKEVDITLKNCKGVLSYEALLHMEYLDMVLSETLRKWPGAIAVDRVCVKPYTIQPDREGEVLVHLKTGDHVLIPIYGFHLDQFLFPNPDRFDPERFNEKNKSSVEPNSFLPFGIGPRSCIGSRFALLESKILMFNILKSFEIVVVEKSVVPVKISRKQFSLNSDGGFWFGFKKRKISN